SWGSTTSPLEWVVHVIPCPVSYFWLHPTNGCSLNCLSLSGILCQRLSCLTNSWGS
ncbi:hypothetical protein MKW98_022058, partial [Papaver atlanticum]